jgi:hypothetical protein
MMGMLGFGGSSGSNPARGRGNSFNVDEDGNFSVGVMEKALSQCGLSMVS